MFQHIGQCLTADAIQGRHGLTVEFRYGLHHDVDIDAAFAERCGEIPHRLWELTDPQVGRVQVHHHSAHRFGRPGDGLLNGAHQAMVRSRHGRCDGTERVADPSQVLNRTVVQIGRDPDSFLF